MECVLQWLAPRDVAAVALTCRAMAAAARDLTLCRAADAAQGMERFAISVVNLVDDCRYPYFEYSPVSVRGRAGGGTRAFAFPGPGITASSVDSFDFGDFGGSGCSCEECEASGVSSQERDDELTPVESLEEEKRTKKRRLASAICPCGRTVLGEAAYDLHSSRLLCFTKEKKEKLIEDLPLIYECGPACSCKIDCRHRISQQGVSVHLKVVRHPFKGWSLEAAQDIKSGTFICEYAGELLTTPEARRRHQIYDSCSKTTSLLVVREHLPSGKACLRLNIDATNTGNIARFLNHSCDGGNLLSCLVRSAGSCVARLVFFAGREIHAGEELTFSYGVVDPGRALKACHCGTSQCRGFLPSEKT